MRFKDFFYLPEDANNSTDKGMMGYPDPSSTEVPSKGPGVLHPSLLTNAGSKPRQGGGMGGGTPMGGAPMGGPKMMKKQMKKN